MLRIIIILFIVVLILTAFIFPQFRRSLWATLVVVLCLLAGIIWFDNRQRELDQSRFSLNHVELLNMQVKPGLQARSYLVKGRIGNQSNDLTINMVVLQVTLKDCRNKHCPIIGQEERRIFLKVPPGQSRDFAVAVPFSSRVNVQGTPEWEFAALKVQTQ